ncbi:MAG TPA: hypothetical protein VGI83_07690 [Gemmatimonadales bacterium]
MYRSLTLLAADDEGAARNPDRLRKLGKHRTLVPWGKAVSFAAIVLMGIAWMLIMTTVANGPAWYFYLIVGLFVVMFAFTTRRNYRLARHDVLRRAAEEPQQFAFAPAKIIGFAVRSEGSGRYQYDVIDATVQFETSGKEAIQLVSTFDKSIWNFSEGQFPIAARVVYQLDNPTRAALISVSASAISQIDPKKKRAAGGYWLMLTFGAILFLFSAAVLFAAVWMVVGKLSHKG